MKQGWEYKKLGEVCRVVTGSTPKTNIQEYWDGEYPWVTPAELKGDVYVNDTVRHITKEAIANTNLTLMPIGTVLLSSRAPIGKVGITTREMYCNQGFKNLICSEVINNKYLYLWLNGKTEYLNSLGRGATFKEISKTIVENIQIPLPPLPVQQSIVAELDEINNLLSLKRKELEIYDKLAQSLFYEMFGDPVENEKGWEVNSMPNVCSIIDGDRGANYPKQDEFHENGYCLFLNAKNVTSTGFNFESCSFITKEKDDILRKGKLNKGDVVLTTRGTIGNLAYYDNSIPYDNVRINSGMVILRMDKTVINEVFYIKQFNFHLNNIKRRIASGSAQPQLPISTMNKIKLIIPPLPLQQTFATRIEAIDNQKAHVKAAIEKLETLLAARMQYWFE